MKFGYHHPWFGDDPAVVKEELINRVRFLEDAGFGWFSMMDHLWQLPLVGTRDEPFVECYTGLSAVAAVTESMDLSALVTCPHYRHPGFLARTLASLDLLSGGRAMLAIGAGWYEAEYEALGVDFPDPATRVRQLRDVIKLCRAAWTDESPVTYAGEYYKLDGFVLEPKPDIPILVGGPGEQLTLRVAAEYADAWNTINRSVEVYAHKIGVLREHCDAADRDIDDLETTFTATVVIRSGTNDAHAAYESLTGETDHGPIPRGKFRGLVGTAEEVAAAIDAYRRAGMDTFQIMVPRNDRETLERFADDVMPAVTA